jgi:hypothetical protein
MARRRRYTHASSTRIWTFSKGSCRGYKDNAHRKSAKIHDSKHLIVVAVHEGVGSVGFDHRLTSTAHSLRQPFILMARTLFTRRRPPLISDSPWRSFSQHFVAMYTTHTPWQKGRLKVRPLNNIKTVPEGYDGDVYIHVYTGDISIVCMCVYCIIIYSTRGRWGVI